MAETHRKFDADFEEGPVRLVRETGKPIAQVTRDLRINSGTLENWEFRWRPHDVVLTHREQARRVG